MNLRFGDSSPLRAKPILLGFFGLTLAIAVWYWFRPERLFINQTVNESAPPDLVQAQPKFTVLLHAVGTAESVEGRANVIQEGPHLKLFFSKLVSNTGNELSVWLTPADKQSSVSHELGKVAVKGHEHLTIPPDLDLGQYNTVVIKDGAGRQVAEGTLEAF